ncbi:hypothetical protein COBT_003005 [Conglomerata obtusa]
MNFDVVIDILYLFFIGVKNKQIKLLMGISKATISKIIRSSLKLIRNYLRINQQLLGGDEVIDEDDESLFDRRKFKRRCQENQTWVIGFVEKTIERNVIFAQ